MVISIIALLIAMLLPAVKRARELARRAVCASNQRALGIAVIMYRSDFAGTFPPPHFKNYPQGAPKDPAVSPPHQSLAATLWPDYVALREVFFDPSRGANLIKEWDCCQSRSIGYYYMARYTVPTHYPYPATRRHDGADRMILQCKAADVIDGDHHAHLRGTLEGVNALYVGGHVQWVAEEQLMDPVNTGVDWWYRWVPNAGY